MGFIKKAQTGTGRFIQVIGWPFTLQEWQPGNLVMLSIPFSIYWTKLTWEREAIMKKSGRYRFSQT